MSKTAFVVQKNDFAAAVFSTAEEARTWADEQADKQAAEKLPGESRVYFHVLEVPLNPGIPSKKEAWIRERIQSTITRPEMYGSIPSAEGQVLNLLEVLVILKGGEPGVVFPGFKEKCFQEGFGGPTPISEQEDVSREKWQEIMRAFFSEIADGLVLPTT